MEKKLNLLPSTIETIDAALLEFVEGLKLNCNTINGWEEVPVIWSSAERAYQIKNNRKIRDESGTLIAPIISIERAATAKDPNRKGGFINSVSPKADRYIYSQKLNQDATAKFANNSSIGLSNQINFVTSKKNNKQVYEFYSVPIPVYVTVDYKINIFTNYQSQMNEILQPFIARTGQNYFLIQKDNHRFECFMDQDFNQESITNLGEEERKFKTILTIKVLGYLIGEGANGEKSSYDIVENAVEFEFPKERLAVVDGNLNNKVLDSECSNGVSLASSGVPVKKTYVIGNDVDAIYKIVHNLRTRDIFVQVRENFGPLFSVVQVNIEYTDVNFITVDMGGVIPLKSYSVTIMG